jgi:cyclomaltodextrinase / maltogenic alpha-amylase / neopullulanase
MKKSTLFFFALAVAALFQGCSKNPEVPVSKDPAMLKLAGPILIGQDSTILELQDYFTDPKKIDSVFIDPSLEFAISVDTLQIMIKPVVKDFPLFTVLKVWIEGYSYDLLLEKSAKTHFWFSFDPKGKKYKKVRIAGQMNDWNPSGSWLFQKDNKWYADLFLFPGRYQYKLILDDKWSTDPNNPDSVGNGSGGYNSLLTLGNLSRAGLPSLFTVSAGKHEFKIGTTNAPEKLFVFWGNYLLDTTFVRRDSSGYTIRIPGNAGSFDRSFIRVMSYNKTGISNELLIPLDKGKVVLDPKNITREDKEAMVMYFLMVDRFKNGNKENDATVNDSLLDPKVNFQGGDIAGVTEMIKSGYFTDLGVNALWISPITQNPLTAYTEYPEPHRKFSGYHGYWPVTLTTIDSRFGSPDELKDLVSAAHKDDINVILDFVSHHVHQENKTIQEHPEWITQFDLPGGKKNVRLFDEQRLTTWFDSFLPTLDLTNLQVANMMSDSALFWLREYDLDGFRHDAAKHVPESYWRLLDQKMNAQIVVPEKRVPFQIGETFGSRELIGSYVNPGMLDAQFDFNLHWDATTAIGQKSGSFRDLDYSIHQSFNYFGDHNLMGNITGNQDMPRFISFASGALSYQENAVEAGWKRDIEVKDTMGYHKLASLIAFNMTIPGIPVIYYGDEYGMPGAGDPDNRRMMQFDSLKKPENALRETTRMLTKLRNNNLALTYGDFTTLKVTDKIYVYMRSYFDQAVIVILNKDDDAKSVEFDIPARFADAKFKTNFGASVSVTNGKAVIEVKPNSFEILTK